MELDKRRRWTKIAAIGMGFAALVSLFAGLFLEWNLPRILMVVCFGASSALYMLQYRQLLKEEE
jgi:hypothetical protein